MSTIFRDPHTSQPYSVQFSDPDPHRPRALHKNCTLAPPPHARSPPTKNCYTFSPRGVPSTGTPSTSPSPSPSPNTSVDAADYFDSNNSDYSTPQTSPATSRNLQTSPDTPEKKPHSTSPPSPTIQLQPFTSPDAPALASLFDRCFATDELRLAQHLPQNISPKDPFEERRWRIGRFNKALQVTGNRLVKAVDTSIKGGGKIVGAAGFFGPGGYQWGVDPPGGRSVQVDLSETLPRHWNSNVKARTDKVFEEMRESVLHGDYGVWELAQIFVDPDYQRQGIGNTLMQWGLRQADRDGYPMYVESTGSAKAFYERLGFVTRAEACFEGVVGADGEVYRMYFMVREGGAWGE
ncbi:acyl-CoA N-acyltransferase [Byssothecium circinans]|uniref:Acyl-CoA N-acyltransferase n=1 Tax=Byssothecium circinans TaxID=147558 RepID=A0A6A5TQA7_9PLEO|nr:acyl-CoA N-acyltransferase [Byssothecium circinans]